MLQKGDGDGGIVLVKQEEGRGGEGGRRRQFREDKTCK